MDLSTAQRKIILLYNRLFNLWTEGSKIGKHHVVKSKQKGFEFAFYCKDAKSNELLSDSRISVDKLRSWWRSTPNAENIIDLHRLIKIYFPRMPYKAPLSDGANGCDVMEFAESIGLSRCQARFIIDRQFARDLPSYSSVVDTYANTRNFTQENGGLYYLYRMVFSGKPDGNKVTFPVLSRSTVSIRYPVPYSSIGPDDTPSKGYRVRTKIVVPATEGDGQYVYDGYVASPNNKGWWRWLLQMRPSNDGAVRDLINMYTQPKRKKFYSIKNTDHIEIVEWVRSGVMLTQTQSESIDMNPLVCKVCLVKLNVSEPRAAKLIEMDDDILRTMADNRQELTVNGNKFFHYEPDLETQFIEKQTAIITPYIKTEYEQIDALAMQVLHEDNCDVDVSGLLL